MEKLLHGNITVKKLFFHPNLNCSDSVKTLNVSKPVETCFQNQNVKVSSMFKLSTKCYAKNLSENKRNSKSKNQTFQENFIVFYFSAKPFKSCVVLGTIRGELRTMKMPPILVFIRACRAT